MAKEEYKRILEPLSVKSMKLRNRLVWLPVGCCYATSDNFVTGGQINYYAARAAHVGLATVEVTTVREKGGLFTRQVGAYDDKFIPGLAKLCEAMKSKGAAAAIQLVDFGARSGGISGTGEPLAPSKLAAGDISRFESIEMSVSQIEELVIAFGEGARRVYQAGADAVEIHSAHLYLINQFLSPHMNKRTDNYGGSTENRARFLLEIIKAIKERVPEDFPIICRINGDEPFEDGMHIEEAKMIAQLVEKAGVDIISVSRIMRKQEFDIKDAPPFAWMTSTPPKEVEEGCNVFLAAAIKSVVKVPVMTAGKIYSLKLGEQVLREAKADLIGLARGLIADPDFPAKELEGRVGEIRRCKEEFLCLRCVGSDKPMECAANKALPPENISTPT